MAAILIGTALCKPGWRGLCSGPFVDGDDLLLGGTGIDTLNGGAGNDFIFGSAMGLINVPTSVGFTPPAVSSGAVEVARGFSWVTQRAPGARWVGDTAVFRSIAISGAYVGSEYTWSGNDRMIGGAGDDVYVVDDMIDAIVEDADGGVDTVQSSISWRLGKNLENLVLTGTNARSATGNASDNLLIGNSAANSLIGGIGADTMAGAAGDDRYSVDDAGDVVVENANEGTDLVESRVSFTLSANVENLTLTGGVDIDGTGNGLANVLTGNGAANVLTGGGGNDTLDGGAGADALIGGVGNDRYLLGQGYGAELIQENDATAGNTDVLQFLSGVTSEQIWFRHTGNDLEVSIIGTADKATLQNWYLGSAYHVEQFKTSDGKTLLDSKVQDLVSAMAAFTPPALGQMSLAPGDQAALLPVIAAGWLP